MEISCKLKSLKTLFKWIIGLMALPTAYLLAALLLSLITVNRSGEVAGAEHSIYLSTNGVHLFVVLRKSDCASELLEGLNLTVDDQYLAFGWGDENFYLNTPTWSDLTIGNALKALFLKSPTLINVTRYRHLSDNWIEVPVSKEQFAAINDYLLGYFQTDDKGHKIHLIADGYSMRNDFYRANGNYSMLKTCNTWVNSAFKNNGLKACVWTPFDFGLLWKYR